VSNPAVMHGVLRHIRRSERRRLFEVLTDAELLARFLTHRDEAAFEELVSRHGPMVRAVCRRVLGRTADADDAFQAAFLIFLRKARSIRRTDLLANWLCAVAYRTARQALRRRYRLGLRERTGDDLPDLGRPDDPPRDWLPLFDAALQRLPGKYRDPVVLCELQGVSRPEAARKLGLNEGTLSSRLGRARDLLRQRLGRYGFPLSVGAALAPTAVPEALTASTAAAALSVSAASVSAVVLMEGVLTAMLVSKLKAGAACSAVLIVGVIAGIQLTGPATHAGGPPGKDTPAKEAPKEATTPGSVSAKPEPPGTPVRLSAEYEPFQGEWRVVGVGGKEGAGDVPVGVSVDDCWQFKGTCLKTGAEADEDSGTPFTLGTRARLTTIDFTLAQFAPGGTGALIRTEHQGIYKFDENGYLVICFRRKADGVVRPTRFATAPNSGAVLVELRRAEPIREPATQPDSVPPTIEVKDPFPMKVSKAPKADAAPKDADLPHVLGAWELTDVDGVTPDAATQKLDQQASVPRQDGSPLPPRTQQRWEALRRLQLLPGGGPIDLVNRPLGPSYVAYVETDASRSPKWITLRAIEEAGTVPGTEVTRVASRTVRLCGIYKLDGEKLMLCLPEAEVSPLLRPTEFKGDGEGGLYLLTYKRAAKNWKPDIRTTPPSAAPPSASDVPTIGRAPDRFEGPPPVAPVATPTPATTGPVPVGEDLPPQPSEPVVSGAQLPPAPSVAEVPPRPPEVTVADARPASDLDRLQGVWVLAGTDYKPRAAAEELSETTLEFLKDRVLLVDGTYGRVRLDEGKSPKRIVLELQHKGAKPLTGIYKLEGDKLTIAAYTRSGKLMPTDFEADAEAGISVAVYERVKGDRPPKATPGAERSKPSESAPTPLSAPDMQFGIRGLKFRLPYTVAEPKSVAVLHLYRSDDKGRSWVKVDAAAPVAASGHFDVRVPRAGTYWFALQFEGPDARLTPARLEPLVKVKAEADDSSIPPADRDLQSEVDQLREQLKRLEKELKDRKPGGTPDGT
jgi:RNA polymerase sigma factor (sigma-70 family)